MAHNKAHIFLPQILVLTLTLIFIITDLHTTVNYYYLHVIKRSIRYKCAFENCRGL